jgi:hypothetical protein
MGLHQAISRRQLDSLTGKNTTIINQFEKRPQTEACRYYKGFEWTLEDYRPAGLRPIRYWLSFYIPRILLTLYLVLAFAVFAALGSGLFTKRVEITRNHQMG